MPYRWWEVQKSYVGYTALVEKRRSATPDEGKPGRKKVVIKRLSKTYRSSIKGCYNLPHIYTQRIICIMVSREDYTRFRLNTPHQQFNHNGMKVVWFKTNRRPKLGSMHYYKHQYLHIYTTDTYISGVLCPRTEWLKLTFHPKHRFYTINREKKTRKTIIGA